MAEKRPTVGIYTLGCKVNQYETQGLKETFGALGYEIAESRDWYQKKMLRDKTARREYFDVERNKRQRGDLYITQIMDEEMMPGDPRLR